MTQTFCMIATDMGLGGCVTGIINIGLFAKVTGIEFHVEGPVGQFAIGRSGESSALMEGSDLDRDGLSICHDLFLRVHQCPKQSGDQIDNEAGKRK